MQVLFSTSDLDQSSQITDAGMDEFQSKGFFQLDANITRFIHFIAMAVHEISHLY